MKNAGFGMGNEAYSGLTFAQNYGSFDFTRHAPENLNEGGDFTNSMSGCPAQDHGWDAAGFTSGEATSTFWEASGWDVAAAAATGVSATST